MKRTNIEPTLRMQAIVSGYFKEQNKVVKINSYDEGDDLDLADNYVWVSIGEEKVLVDGSRLIKAIESVVGADALFYGGRRCRRGIRANNDDY